MPLARRDIGAKDDPLEPTTSDRPFAVIKQPLVRDMRQGVDVAGRFAVEVNPDEIHVIGRFILALVAHAGSCNADAGRPLSGPATVSMALASDNWLSRLDQSRRLGHFFVAEKIKGAQFVVCPPTPPVFQFLEEMVELTIGEGELFGGHLSRLAPEAHPCQPRRPR